MDPQRLNLYAHARNNPLKYIDSDGRDIVLGTQDKAEQKVIKQALVQIAKTKSGREFLTRLDNLNVVFSLTVGKAPGEGKSENYGVTKIPRSQAAQIQGQGEKATGTIIIEINPGLIKTANDANKKMEEANRAYMEATGGAAGPPKPLPYPGAPKSNAEAMGHELYHGDKQVNEGTGGDHDDATNAAKAMLSDKNKPDSKEKPEDFVNRIVEPKKKPDEK